MKSQQRKNARPAITELAVIIEDDIKSRSLTSGDPYLSLAETARMLKTSNAGANSALQLLVKKGILERKQRRGAFVSCSSPKSRHSICRIHLLSDKDFLKQEGVITDEQVVGIQSELPQTEIHFNFLPKHDQRDYVQELVNKSLAEEGLSAFVLYSTSLDAQRILIESGLPTVVVGSLYPSIIGLPWVDMDQNMVASTLFSHLYHKHNCQQFLVLMRERSYPGDYKFMDTLQQCFSQYDISQNSVLYRSLPSDLLAIEAEVRTLLLRLDSTTGIITRSVPLAKGARLGVKKAGRILNKEVYIAASSVFGQSEKELKYYSYVRPRISPEEFGVYLGQALKQFVANGFKSNEYLEIPVEIEQ